MKFAHWLRGPPGVLRNSCGEVKWARALDWSCTETQCQGGLI